MFKKPTRRQVLIRRIILLTIAAIAVVIIVTVSILSMLGYRLDSGNGTLEQGALLQFDSKPNGASVFIDGTDIGSRTPNKQTVIAGTHTITMIRDGYEKWSRTLNLMAGTLTWLDYVRFVPKDRPIEQVTTHPSLSQLVFSPDNKWAITQEVASVPSFQLVDLRAEQVKSTPIIIPQSVYSEASTPDITHSFNVVAWDSGSRYITVNHLFRDQSEWLVVDTQNPNSTINISQLLGVGFRDVQFLGTSGKTFYALTHDGTLRKIDVSAATLSRVFVTHVSSFNVFDNAIVSYVGINPADATKRVAGVYRDGDESPHVVYETDVSDNSLHIAIGRYHSDDIVAIADGISVNIRRGSYPSSSSQDISSLQPFANFTTDSNVTALSLSPNTDYVLAQSGATFKTYEIEHQRLVAGAVAVPTGVSPSTLRWLDAAHLWDDLSGTLVMRDFTGSNVFSIMKVEPGFSASLSQNGRFFYAVGKTDKGYHLQRIKMILD